MTVESATFVNQLNSSLPAGSDIKSEGDDHLRLIKAVSLASFPSVGAAVGAGHADLAAMGNGFASITTSFCTINSGFLRRGVAGLVVGYLFVTMTANNVFPVIFLPAGYRPTVAFKFVSTYKSMTAPFAGINFSITSDMDITGALNVMTFHAAGINPAPNNLFVGDQVIMAFSFPSR
jgi:hypothetical protein